MSCVDVEQSSGAILQTSKSSKLECTTFNIKGTREQILKALQLITISTGLKVSCLGTHLFLSIGRSFVKQRPSVERLKVLVCKLVFTSDFILVSLHVQVH